MITYALNGELYVSVRTHSYPRDRRDGDSDTLRYIFVPRENTQQNTSHIF